VHLILTLSSIMKGPERGKIISRRSKGIVNLITPWRPAVDTRNRRGSGLFRTQRVERFACPLAASSNGAYPPLQTSPTKQNIRRANTGEKQ
jgi:hypothetical protein